MLHACTSRGAMYTARQGRIVGPTGAKLYFWQIFQFFFFIQMGPGPTHPPTSKLFLDFWNFFNFAKPLISISEVMMPNHGNGPKSTHGACPGSKKHKTICTLACLTPLLYVMHGNNSHYASGGHFIKYTQNAEKRQ